MQDLTNKKSGRLTILHIDETRSTTVKSRLYWTCQGTIECGV